MPKSLKDLVAAAKKRIREITAADAADAVKKSPKTLILDVREPGEWAEGHIPGALHVPRGMLEDAGMQVVGEAADGLEGVAQPRRSVPMWC